MMEFETYCIVCSLVFSFCILVILFGTTIQSVLRWMRWKWWWTGYHFGRIEERKKTPLSFSECESNFGFEYLNKGDPCFQLCSWDQHYKETLPIYLVPDEEELDPTELASVLGCDKVVPARFTNEGGFLHHGQPKA
jgi:hypothetical protein